MCQYRSQDSGKQGRDGKRTEDIPYKETMVPFLEGDTFTSFTASFRSAMNVSTIDTVKRFIISI
jgi:uncharacterized protein YPO0396